MVATKTEHFADKQNAIATLANDSCSIPKDKLKVNLAEVSTRNSCKSGGGCC